MRTPFRHAVKWAYVMTAGQRGIALVVTFIHATILGPRAFGLMAMAAAYVIFIEMFVAQGLAAAIIQRRGLKREHLESVFWMNLAAGVALAGISVALSPWWAAVNGQPDLAPVIMVLSLSIPIKGFTVVQHALLQRRMDFRNLALLGGVSSFIGAVVGVTMALSGCGVWSLVAQQLTAATTSTAIMWTISRWRPRARFSPRHARQLLGFSAGVFASQLGVYTTRQADAVIVGIFFGPVAVGLYRLAESLVEMLLEVSTRPIQVVALPHFSRLQNRPAGLQRAMLSCIRFSATAAIPALILTAAVSDRIMAAIGAQWDGAADVLKILVALGVAKAVVLFSGPLLLAAGRARSVAALTWIPALATAAAVAATAAALAGRPIEVQIAGVAIARTIVYLLLGGVLRLVVVKVVTAFSMQQLAEVLVPSLAAALAAVVTVTALAGAGAGQPLPALVALVSVAAPAALAAAVTVAALDRHVRHMLLAPLRWVQAGGDAAAPFAEEPRP